MSDGRRGHDNQSLGLTEALARRAPVRTVDVPVRGGASGAVASLAGRPPGPAPSLVLGAGHATHLALIIAARRQRARSVVLMNPSLPRALFDLCLVPVHDGVAEGGNVLLSLGALNRLRPSRERDPQQSLSWWAAPPGTTGGHGTPSSGRCVR